MHLFTVVKMRPLNLSSFRSRLPKAPSSLSQVRTNSVASKDHHEVLLQHRDSLCTQRHKILPNACEISFPRSTAEICRVQHRFRNLEWTSPVSRHRSRNTSPRPHGIHATDDESSYERAKEAWGVIVRGASVVVVSPRSDKFPPRFLSILHLCSRLPTSSFLY